MLDYLSNLSNNVGLNFLYAFIKNLTLGFVISDRGIAGYCCCAR
uniref:Uncharacterized protein n=1 Tax=uncultured nuHF1 cluster bacterium HF0130_31E21 TaxID=710728 RepID=E0XTN5_9BACT|nr:hypothetical protein [uncultured nuHF1 cluster bacterium HF0130_31E21]